MKVYLLDGGITGISMAICKALAEKEEIEIIGTKEAKQLNANPSTYLVELKPVTIDFKTLIVDKKIITPKEYGQKLISKKRKK